MIVICCKYTNDIGIKTEFKVPNKFPYVGPTSTIIDVVDACKVHMPNEKIVVVDSDSEDKSYYELIDVFDIIEGNSNYEAGAIWKAFEKYPDEDYYLLLQDTTIPTTNLIKELKDNDVIGFWYTNDWESDMEGCREWAIKNIKITNIEYISYGFKSILNNIFIVKNKVLKELKDKSFNKVLPNDKISSASMERLWGIVFKQMGYKLKHLLPHIYDVSKYTLHENPYIIKNFGKKE
jgi:hypothetical protein